MKKNFYFKIGLILFLSFFLADFSSKNLFLSYSPRLRPNLIAYFSSKIKNQTDKFLSLFRKNQFFTQNSKTNEKEIYNYLIKNLKPVAKGVKASTYKNYSYTEVKLSEVEWVKIEVIDVDGRKKIINVPKKY